MERKIRVGEKALAHLSRGLYRSPASALRELVSNAWDANATSVRISTGYPNFYEIRVSDNGDGFSRRDFETLMEGTREEIGGIGNSLKRSRSVQLTNNRQIIGRLGIGMLGISQFCPSFVVTSKVKGERGFSARVRLYDLLKQQLDSDSEEIVSPQAVDVGVYEFVDSDLSKVPVGTTIYADDVHPTFIQSFQTSCSAPDFEEPSLDWSENIQHFSRQRTLQELGHYWRLIWELSLACPLPYVNSKALPEGLVKQDNDRLRRYDFEVFLDNIKLAKPIHLCGNEHGYTCYAIPRQEKRTYGKPVCYHGYIAVQEGHQLQPDELRGILIRIKDVAIGYYDTSMLDYRYNEGPRSRWVTGEVFISDGLEDALNLDRESFNRFHPEFRELQNYLHETLQHKIFREVYKKLDQRSEMRKEVRKDYHATILREVVQSSSEKKVRFKSIKGTAKDKPDREVRVEGTDSGMTVAMPDVVVYKTKKSARDLARAIFAIYEISQKKNSPTERQRTFYDLIQKLLFRW